MLWAEVDSVSSGLVRYEERAHDGATSSNQPREYEDIVKMVYEKDRTTVEVDFKHVLNFDDDLADRIKVCACACICFHGQMERNARARHMRRTSTNSA